MEEEQTFLFLCFWRSRLSSQIIHLMSVLYLDICSILGQIWKSTNVKVDGFLIFYHYNWKILICLRVCRLPLVRLLWRQKSKGNFIFLTLKEKSAYGCCPIGAIVIHDKEQICQNYFCSCFVAHTRKNEYF